MVIYQRPDMKFVGYTVAGYQNRQIYIYSSSDKDIIQQFYDNYHGVKQINSGQTYKNI